MSDSGPDGMLALDADDATPPNYRVVAIYHDGSQNPDLWDKCPTSVSEPMYDDLKAEADVSQAAFNTEAGSAWGGWFNGKPPEAKECLRNVFLKSNAYPG